MATEWERDGEKMREQGRESGIIQELKNHGHNIKIPLIEFDHMFSFRYMWWVVTSK